MKLAMKIVPLVCILLYVVMPVDVLQGPVDDMIVSAVGALLCWDIFHSARADSENGD